MSVAKSCGLAIPDTLLTNNREDVKNFIDANSYTIIKPLSDPHFFTVGDNRFALYTSILKKGVLKNMKKNILPIMIQNKIEKKLEIRIFYISGKIFSAAIFSQTREKTSLDYRNYDIDKPYRVVPYSFSLKMKNKIKMFMKKMNLNTGSLDIIKDISNNYIFLEVNPVGQFDMLSNTCNFPIEKEIALYLKG